MHTQIWSAFLSGCVLGASCGVAPGPLLTLVIRETLSGGAGAGVRVAAAPLITDFPIIALCVSALGAVAGSGGILGGISLLGGAFVLYLAWDSWRAQPPDLDSAPVRSRSLAKGVLTNILSPHPYLFWVAVGAPILLTGWRVDPLVPFAFLAGFYLLLVGSKLAVALLVGRSRAFLTGGAYRVVLRTLACAMAVFAVFLFRDGWRLLQGGGL